MYTPKQEALRAELYRTITALKRELSGYQQKADTFNSHMAAAKIRAAKQQLNRLYIEAHGQ